MSEAIVDPHSLKVHFIKTTITSLVGTLMICLGGFVAFYYNTTNDINNSKEKIKTIISTQNVHEKSINKILIQESGDTEILKSLDKRTGLIEGDVHGINQKTDDILMILIDRNKNNK